MTLTRFVVVALALVFVSPVPTWAAAFTVTDTTVITASLGTENDLGPIDAGDGAVFVAPGGPNWTVQRSWTLPAVDLSVQHQTLTTPLGFTASSHMDGHGRDFDDAVAGLVFGKAHVTEHLNVLIDLATASAFQFLFTGTVVTDEEAQIHGWFGGQEWWTDLDHGYGEPLQVQASGQWGPGRHMITIESLLRANGSSGFPIGRYSYDLALNLEPVVPVPEPGTLALIAAGAGVLLARWKRGATR